MAPPHVRRLEHRCRWCERGSSYNSHGPQEMAAAIIASADRTPSLPPRCRFLHHYPSSDRSIKLTKRDLLCLPPTLKSPATAAGG